MTDFKKTVSSGGVIVKLIDGEPRVLVLVTKDEKKGFLPKGHVEEGETLEQAALREVHEEAGLTKLKIVEKIGVHERRVDRPNAKEDKTIHMFLMVTTVDGEECCPLEESSNLDFNWCSLEELPEMYIAENRDVIEKNAKKIREILLTSANTNN